MASNGQKIILALFVLVISMLIGWKAERAVEKFMNSNASDIINNRAI